MDGLHYYGIEQRVYKDSLPTYTRYLSPIDRSPNRLFGESREWGDVKPEVSLKIKQLILKYAEKLSLEDRAILLGIVEIESGFNPDAAAKTTSAAGLFQFVRKTGSFYGLNDRNIFDAESNIIAGVKHFCDNIKSIEQKTPYLKGAERATRIYALHHDGPTLSFGGEKIAQTKLLPLIEKYSGFVMEEDFKSKTNRIKESVFPAKYISSIFY